jgi:hypothetical protein
MFEARFPGEFSDGFRDEIRRQFFLDYINQLHWALRSTKPTSITHCSMLLSKYCQDRREYVKGLPTARLNKLGQMASLIQNIQRGCKFALSLEFVMRAMATLGLYDDQSVGLAIAMSGNLDLFEFQGFLTSFVLQQEEILDTIFSQDEKGLLKRFSAILQVIEDAA